MSTSQNAPGASPARGEVWDVDLNPVVGHDQRGRRPALVVSVDELNHSPRGLVAVLPLTSKDRGFPTHVPVAEPEGGLTVHSVVMADQIRTISTSRLISRRGSVTPETMAQVEFALRFVLGL